MHIDSRTNPQASRPPVVVSDGIRNALGISGAADRRDRGVLYVTGRATREHCTLGSATVSYARASARVISL